MIKQSLKDFEVARAMFGSNTKDQCNIVKKMRSKGVIESLTEDWSIISNPNIDECGWLIPNECLEGIIVEK